MAGQPRVFKPLQEQRTKMAKQGVFLGCNYDHQNLEPLTPPHMASMVPRHDGYGWAYCVDGSKNNLPENGGRLSCKLETVVKSDFHNRDMEFTSQAISNRHKRFQKFTSIMTWEFKRDLLRMMTKIQFIKPEVDDKPPKKHSLLDAERHRQEVEEGRLKVIKRENQEMSRRISRIHNRPKSSFCNMKKKQKYLIKGDAFRIHPPSKRPLYLVEMYKKVKLANPLHARKSIRLQQEMLTSATDLVKKSNKNAPSIVVGDEIILLTLEEQSTIAIPDVDSSPSNQEEANPTMEHDGSVVKEQDGSVVEEQAKLIIDEERSKLTIDNDVQGMIENINAIQNQNSFLEAKAELTLTLDSNVENVESKIKTIDSQDNSNQVTSKIGDQNLHDIGLTTPENETPSKDREIPQEEPKVEILRYSIDKIKKTIRLIDPRKLKNVDLLDYDLSAKSDSGQNQKETNEAIDDNGNPRTIEHNDGQNANKGSIGVEGKSK